MSVIEPWDQPLDVRIASAQQFWAQRHLMRTYDAVQRGAVLLSWICCRRTVYATHPEKGCSTCR